METVGDRIKKEREAQGLERADLVRLTKIGYSTIAELENNGMKSTTKLHLIASALGVNANWLATGRLPKEPVVEDPDWPAIPAYAQAVGLGEGAEADEYAESHKLKFKATSLRRKRLNPKDLCVFYGKGDSMLPRIHDGDAVLFDTGDTTPKHGQIYVIQVHGLGVEYQAKRAMILDGTVYFEALNPSGDHKWQIPRRMDDKKSPIAVVGRVRWIGSWED